MSDEPLDLPIYRRPERRHCDGCEEMVKLKLKVAFARGGIVILLMLMTIMVTLSYKGLQKGNYILEKFGPELAIASHIAGDVKDLQDENKATSSAVIVLTEQMKHYTFQTGKLAKSVDKLAEKIR